MYSGINVMQAQLGLAGSGENSSFGIPTPGAPQMQTMMPQVRHPGEVSQMVVQQSQASQTALRNQEWLPSPSVGPLGSAVGNYGQQFQQNMSSMQTQIFNPYVAQMMAGMGGMPNFMSGMLPSPIQMTSPNMGIFRPFPQPMSPSLPPTPYMPLFQTPMTPQPSPAQFSTQQDYNWQMGQQRALQYDAGVLATPGVVGHVATNAGFALAGRALGANIGARLAGTGGAKLGGGLGMAAGYALSELGGFARAGQGIADGLNPLRTMSQRTTQMMGMSPEFVIGGPELSADGRGLGRTGARNLAHRVESLGYDDDFRKATRNMFNSQDLTRITQMAGQQGLLDMHQGSERIARQVKEVSKVLRTMMQIVGEPDVQEAISQMGRMSQMGLSLPSMNNTVRNAAAYARMSGTTVKGIMEAGLTGAAMYQSQGLTAGLGFEMGMGATGMAHQAVAGGTYTRQQLAMLGGASGIAQRDMMSQLSTLKMPMLTAATATYGPGGFALDPSAALGVLRGKTDIHQMATMGANNLLNAVSEGGVGALGLFQVQQRELQGQLGEALGPMGMKLMDFQQVMQTRKLLGLDKNAGGLATAALAMGKDEDQVRQILSEANSPESFRNLQRHLDVEKSQGRAEEMRRRNVETVGIGDRWLRKGRLGAEFFRGVGDVDRYLKKGSRRFSGAFDEAAEDEAAWKSGQVVVRTSRNLLASNEIQSRRMRNVGVNEDVLRDAYDRDSAGMSVEGLESGSTQLLHMLEEGTGGDKMDLAQYARARGGVASYFMGGTAERFARAALLNNNSIFKSSEQVRASLRKQGASASVLSAGLALSDTERGGLSDKLVEAFGGDTDAADRFRATYVKRMAQVAAQKESNVSEDTAIEGENVDIFNKMAATSGLDTSKFNAESMSKLTARSINTRALIDTGDTMRLQDSTSTYNAKALRANLEKSRQGISGALFGTEGASRQRERRERVMEAMLDASSPHVILMAALIANNETDRALAVSRKLPKKDRERAVSEAEYFAQQFAADKDLLKEMAQRMGANLDAGIETIGEMRDTLFANKNTVQYADSVETTYKKDPSLVEGDLTARGILTKLAANRRNLQGEDKKLASDYAEADAAGKEKIEAEFTRTHINRGAVGATNIKGGDAHAGDANINARSAAIAGTQGALEEHFPESIELFSKSSVRMQEAANLIFKTFGGTNYYPVGVSNRR